ncbi:unnamed protein product [Clavelina lepadiformis]|uniref:Uncharacterized protein n=1 Tax=Clavelina lepadiformis TaxID=159417 RepID=A0ABP0F5E4_CLALP
MNETRGILMNLERRFQTFSQQQFTFVTALDRCRKITFDERAQISTIAQVYNYAEHVTDNATDKRIFKIFISLVRDLGEFRRTLTKLAKQKNDRKLNETFATWKRLLEPREDISEVRAKFPFHHVNHLSCDEARNHFGGIISLIPVAIECARNAVERIEVIRAYRHTPSREGARSEQPRRPQSAMPAFNTIDRPIPSPTCRMAQPLSPVISSPVSTATHSRVSLHSATSDMSLPPTATTKTRRSPPSRPSTALGTYRRQAQVTLNEKNHVSFQKRPKSGKATQTPHYLATTLKPALDWPHQTISESEMKKMLKQPKHSLVRPTWKP